MIRERDNMLGERVLMMRERELLGEFIELGGD